MTNHTTTTRIILLLAAATLSACNKNESNSVPMAKIQSAPNDTAQEATPITLKAGDPAPALSIEQWLKGAPVASFQPGTVYIVEFWATWCPPCVANIPHLNKLQAEHPEVVIIGVAASERKPSESQPDTRIEKLNTFIAKREGTKDAITYRMAYDDNRSMSQTWMAPAGCNTIPTAFIVGKDGKLAWIGHPTDMDAQLKSALTAN